MGAYFIKKEVSLEKVRKEYGVIVDEVTTKALALSERVHSIYLYGSVATGKAQSPTSDLDMLVVLHEAADEVLAQKYDELAAEMSAVHVDVFREVGLGVTNLNEVLHGSDPLGWRFFMTVLCVKLQGEDLYEKEKRFRPTTALAKELHSDMHHVLAGAVEKIRGASESVVKLKVHSAMKKIIRAGFGLVMERENYWTVDIEEMVELFCKHYPEQAEKMNEVLGLLRNPAPEAARAIGLVTDFGTWVEAELLGSS